MPAPNTWVMAKMGFHSISFPSEWGPPHRDRHPVCIIARFHSISFPSEWGQELARLNKLALLAFPFN